MKTTNCFFPILLIFLLCIQSCKPKEQLMGIQITERNKPVPNANIVTNVKSIYGITDEDGNLFIEAPKDSIEKIRHLTVFKKISENQYIDSTYNKKLTSINLPKKPKKLEKKRPMSVNKLVVKAKSPKGISPDGVQDNYEDILNFMDQLDFTDSLLAKLEREVDAYMKKHPNSAMRDLMPLVNIRREDMKKLKRQFEQLETTFHSAIVKAGKGDLSNSEFAEMQEKFKQSEELFDLHLQKVTELVVTGDDNMDARQELELKTDFYYDIGKFQIKNLPGNQDENLSNFISKVNQFINDYISKGEKDMVVHVKVVGYTDGLAVNENLSRDFATICQKYGEHKVEHDGNDCLSKLRAEHLAEYLSKAFLNKYAFCDTKAVGYGSANAAPNVEDPNNRRCNASVVVIPRTLEKSIFPR